MPCNDVTELIRVVVDAEDRLKDYRFVKRTCGRGVGVDALLLDMLAGRPVREILEIAPEAFLAGQVFDAPVEEFLRLKHLFALQAALNVLTGHASGGPKDICAVAEVSHEHGETVIDARIAVDLVTDAIRACGNCRDCGSTKAKRRAVSN